MHSTTDAKQTNPHHVLSSHADEELARIQQQLSRLKRDDARHPARQSRDRPWLRGVIGLFIAACIGAAAFVSKSSYRDAVARLAAPLISASSLPRAKLAAINARARTTQAQVTAATAVADRIKSARQVSSDEWEEFIIFWRWGSVSIGHSRWLGLLAYVAVTCRFS
jgi:hypothetical protein